VIGVPSCVSHFVFGLGFAQTTIYEITSLTKSKSCCGLLYEPLKVDEYNIHFLPICISEKILNEQAIY
jgi:hypothetical protein